MRLNKFIAKSGLTSRRKADELIKGASITINGIVELNPAYHVLKNDEVRCESKLVKHQNEAIVIMLNKPKGYITTMEDPMKRKTVMELIDIKERVFPVGRLDKDSTGLLLFTNLGELAMNLAHPKNQTPRVYSASIDKPFANWEKKRLEKKIYIGQKEWGKAIVVEQKKDRGRVNVILKLHHGKKREIRRMMFRMKRKLFHLERIEFGPYKLGSLKIGEWRYLSKEEISCIDL